MENKYAEMTDELLVKQAQQGDADAEEYLIRKYKDVVRGKAHIYFIVGADNEDIVQEGMIGVFKAIKGYNDGKHRRSEDNRFVRKDRGLDQILYFKRRKQAVHYDFHTRERGKISRLRGRRERFQHQYLF